MVKGARKKKTMMEDSSPKNGNSTTKSYAEFLKLTEVDLLRIQRAFLDFQNKQLLLENATMKAQQAQRERDAHKQQLDHSQAEMLDLQRELHRKYDIPDDGSLNVQTGSISRKPPKVVEEVAEVD